jgi:hypothetical protein
MQFDIIILMTGFHKIKVSPIIPICVTQFHGYVASFTYCTMKPRAENKKIVQLINKMFANRKYDTNEVSFDTRPGNLPPFFLC